MPDATTNANDGNPDMATHYIGQIIHSCYASGIPAVGR